MSTINTINTDSETRQTVTQEPLVLRQKLETESAAMVERLTQAIVGEALAATKASAYGRDAVISLARLASCQGWETADKSALVKSIGVLAGKNGRPAQADTIRELLVIAGIGEMVKGKKGETFKVRKPENAEIDPLLFEKSADRYDNRLQHGVKKYNHLADFITLYPYAVEYRDRGTLRGWCLTEIGADMLSFTNELNTVISAKEWPTSARMLCGEMLPGMVHRDANGDVIGRDDRITAVKSEFMSRVDGWCKGWFTRNGWDIEAPKSARAPHQNNANEGNKPAPAPTSSDPVTSVVVTIKTSGDYAKRFTPVVDAVTTAMRDHTADIITAVQEVNGGKDPKEIQLDMEQITIIDEQIKVMVSVMKELNAAKKSWVAACTKLQKAKAQEPTEKSNAA